MSIKMTRVADTNRLAFLYDNKSSQVKSIDLFCKNKHNHSDTLRTILSIT